MELLQQEFIVEYDSWKPGVIKLHLLQSCNGVHVDVVGFFVMAMTKKEEVCRRPSILVGLLWIEPRGTRFHSLNMTEFSYVLALFIQYRMVAAWKGALVFGRNAKVAESLFADGESGHRCLT